MCNKLHSYSRPIRKKGKGWKIFEVVGNSLRQMSPRDAFNRNRTIPPYDKNIWINWSTELQPYESDDFGFCFFLDKNEAERCLKEWRKDDHNTYILLPIEYKKGLGKHLELHIIWGFEFESSLCKEFKIIEEQI